MSTATKIVIGTIATAALFATALILDLAFAA
jgi:hypothetical protein